MDPLAMVASALMAGAAAAAKDTVAQAIKDAYNGLKALVVRKAGASGNNDELSTVINLAERKPDDKARQAMLQDVLQTARVDADVEVLKHAQALLDMIKQYEPGIATQYNISVTGSGAAAAGPGAMAAGERGVVTRGNVQGDINTGTQNINTGGGAFVGGNVSTAGDFVGRDKVINTTGGSADDVGAGGLVTSPEGLKLYQLLNQYFEQEDLEGLCYELGIDQENLRGQTKMAKARALVQQCEKTGRLDELKKLMRVQRSNLRDQLQ